MVPESTSIDRQSLSLHCCSKWVCENFMMYCQTQVYRLESNIALWSRSTQAGKASKILFVHFRFGYCGKLNEM